VVTYAEVALAALLSAPGSWPGVPGRSAARAGGPRRLTPAAWPLAQSAPWQG